MPPRQSRKLKSKSTSRSPIATPTPPSEPLDSTPFRPSSGSNPSGSSPATMSESSYNLHFPFSAPSQQEMKRLIGDELYGATFESKSLASQLCPRSEEVVDSVLSRLSQENITSKYAWPPNTMGEGAFYVPFVKVLNAINTATQQCLMQNDHSRRYYNKLTYSTYNLTTKDSIDGSHPLKPDIVGCNRPIVSPQRVYWSRDILIPVEVKREWPELVAQAGTYARSLYVASSHRRFVLIIGFNHITLEVRFLFFHRGGLTSTLAACLTTPSGWRDFVSVMVGIGSWKSGFHAGMDNASNTLGYILPHFGFFEIAERLCSRISLRGRATQVSRLIPASTKKAEETETPDKDAAPSRPRTRVKARLDIAQFVVDSKVPRRSPRIAGMVASGTLNTSLQALHIDSAGSGSGIGRGDPFTRVGGNARPEASSAPDASIPPRRSKRFTPGSGDVPGSQMPRLGVSSAPPTKHSPFSLEKVEVIEEVTSISPLVCCDHNLIPEHTAIPDSLIIKDSHPLEIRNTEGEMINSVRGEFGVPHLYASYTVKGEDGQDQSTASFFPEDSVYWDVFGAGDFEPERRVHTFQVFETEGKRLDQALSPYDLLEGILHSMIGYLNYYKAGWMHRDVSEGNIMLLAKPTHRKSFDIDVEKYPHFANVIQWTKCVGMLTDGDLAIQWRDPNRDHATRRSGTLPFIAVRLIKASVLSQSYIHTAIDDLESFLWVLLWFTLLITQDRHEMTILESIILENLNSRREKVHLRRYGLIDDLADASLEGDASNLAKRLIPLMRRWEAISREASQALKGILSKEGIGADDDRVTHLTYKYFGQYLNAGQQCLNELPKTWDGFFDSPTAEI